MTNQMATNILLGQMRAYADCLSRDELEAYEKAISALKAQVPRVFNVGDFYGEEFGYLEYRPDTPGFCDFEPCPVLIADIDDENVTVVFRSAFRSAAALKLPLDKVNRRWRIWSDYPSHELLKAVEWE